MVNDHVRKNAARIEFNRTRRIKAAANCPPGVWVPLSDLDVRPCDKCRETKPMEEFGKNTAVRRNTICRPCVAAAKNLALSEAQRRRYTRHGAGLRNGDGDAKPGRVRVGQCPNCRSMRKIAFVPWPGGVCPCGWRVTVKDEPKEKR